MAWNPYGDDSPNSIPNEGNDPEPPKPKEEKSGWGIFRPLSEWGTPEKVPPKEEKTRSRYGTSDDSGYSQGGPGSR